MGVSWEEFWHMNPHIIKCISEGYRKKQEMRDREMWSWFGNYGISAMIFAIEHCFAKNPKTSYLENPVSEGESKNQKVELTEEERIQAERNRQYMILKVMQANFEISRSRKEKE